MINNFLTIGSASGFVYSKVVDAFQPLIEATQAFAYPLAYISNAIGICLIIMGQKRAGTRWIKWGTAGYIMMQWLPAFMDILKDVGDAMH